MVRPDPRTEVSEVALDCAWTDAREFGRARDRSADGNEGGEDVDLTLCRLRRERTAQVPVPHASRRAVAIHSSRPSIRVRLIIRKRRGC